jgi:hypothetical protein
MELGTGEFAIVSRDSETRKVVAVTVYTVNQAMISFYREMVDLESRFSK